MQKAGGKYLRKPLRNLLEKVHPKEKWLELTGGTTAEGHIDDTFDFEGFDEPDQRQYLPSDNLSCLLGAEQSKVINDTFETHIEEIVQYLNRSQDDVTFAREVVIQDVFY